MLTTSSSPSIPTINGTYGLLAQTQFPLQTTIERQLFDSTISEDTLSFTPIIQKSWSVITSSFQTIDRYLSMLVSPFPLAAAEEIIVASSSNCHFTPPENVAFDGGGAKGFAYPGVIKALESMNLHTGIKRIAGTSAGSIAGTLFALGMTADEISAAFHENSIIDFIHAEVTGMEASGASLGFKGLSVLTKVITTYQKAIGKKGLGGMIEIWSEILNLKGLFSGDSFREWIDNKIYQKTGIKYCTFGELQDLINKGEGSYKELHIYATKITGALPESICFSTRDPKWRDLIISDAVLMSSALPGIIKVSIPHFKNSKGVRVSREDLGTFVDGGLLNNLPLGTFDFRGIVEENVPLEFQDEHMNNRKTIGFDLVSSSNVKETALPKNLFQVAKALVKVYLKSQDAHRQSNAYDVRNRIIKIDTQNIGTLGFWKGTASLKVLEESGFNATTQFFNEKMRCGSSIVDEVDVMDACLLGMDITL